MVKEGNRKSTKQPEKDRQRERRREGGRKRERGRERARELHAIRITSGIPQLGYVLFVAQLIGAMSMHIQNSK